MIDPPIRQVGLGNVVFGVVAPPVFSWEGSWFELRLASVLFTDMARDSVLGRYRPSLPIGMVRP